MSKVCRRARVEGKVQGVWFRASTKQRADQLHVAGWANNCLDGSVEVMMFGEESNVTELSDWLWEGPPLAIVDKVLIDDVDGDAPTAFTTGDN